MSTIPASIFTAVNPQVLGAGGAAIALNGLVLTKSTRVPIGAVMSFPSLAAVQAFFGAASLEAAIAGGGVGLGSGYFGGFDNSNVKPGAILFAQYPTAAVAAYLRGGNISALPLASLQALSGTLTLTIDGNAVTSGAINLAAAASFSSAATIIQTALAAADGVVTGAIAPGTASVTGSIAATTMTVTAIGSGTLIPGQTISGTGVTAGTTIVKQLTGTAGSTGTYQVSVSQTVSSTAITATSTLGVLTVSAVTSGVLAIGQVISGAGVTAGTTITALLTGAGGTGTYVVSVSQTASSTTITAGTATVTFDSVSGAFVITAGTPGANSAITFATGSLSAGLLLTAATGAVLSQGSAPAVPATFMSALILVTQNWATFMTAFDPDNGSGNASKLAFAAWTNGTNNQFAYVCWDTDTSPRLSVPAPASLGGLITAANYSGTCLISELTDLNLATFVCGAVASIDFTQTNGRTTLAYRSQTGLSPSVTDGPTAINLGGNPQVTGDRGNGYNYYGAVGAAAQAFNFFQRGLVSGPFNWLDSYINQIWLNANLQSTLLAFFTATKSIPFNSTGYAAIEAALADPINAALNFGAIRPGVTLSGSQIASVNSAAGFDVASTIATRGWYLQIVPASPTVRASRGPLAITLWYADGQSVQSISLTSVNIQ